MNYPLADPGVFHTIQGEGELLGVPMVFVRLAGCSVGCDGCDTNYRKAQSLPASEIADKVKSLRSVSPDSRGWIWVTGGEPFDYDLNQLLSYLRLEGRIAAVTSGRKPLRGVGNMIDFLSVSPHGPPDLLTVTRGSQINLVPGLGETKLSDWERFDFSGFKFKYVTPFSTPNGIDPTSLRECMDWVWRRTDWRMGVQAHKTWGVA